MVCCARGSSRFSSSAAANGGLRRTTTSPSLNRLGCDMKPIMVSLRLDGPPDVRVPIQNDTDGADLALRRRWIHEQEPACLRIDIVAAAGFDSWAVEAIEKRS